MKKRILFFTAVLAAAVFSVSCSALFGSEPPAEETVNAVSFKKTSLAVAVGGSEYLQLTVKPARLQNVVEAFWEYDAAHIAINPDAYGVVITGVMEGSAYIKATINGITAACMVAVSGTDGEFTAEPYIYSNYSVLELTPGSAQTFSVSLYGGQSFDLEDFSWSITDPSLATITTSRNNCIVNTLKAGSTQITAAHPKAAYPYTLILYVYADEFTESYLSTETNVITINKAETQTKTVSVSVQNPHGLINPASFSWEVAGEGAPCVSVAANGGTALISALSPGTSLLRVRYEGCAWPLDILVRVTAAVQNVYITPSATTLIVTGSAAPHSVYAEITGYPGFANPDAFVWTVPDEARYYMDWEAVGNTLSVTGKLNGSIKVKVSHELSEYSRSILIVLREQEGSAVDASMYITTSGNYVQTRVGDEAAHITVSLAGGKPGDEQNLVWSIDNGADNDICKIETNTGRAASRSAAGQYAFGNLYITPLRIGTVTITVSHPKVRYETEIIVKVYSPYAQMAEPVYIVSEANLIRMLSGTTREVAVTLTGNTQTGDENAVAWSSGDPQTIGIAPETGSAVVLSALGSGNHQTYVNVSHEKAASEKRILVLSADTPEALDTMKGIYADQTYYRINENGGAALSLNQFGLSAEDIARITWQTDKPGVCTVQAQSGSRLNATVSGITAGTARITAALAGSEPCVFNITVLPEGEPVDAILPQYLTTAQNAVVLSEPGASKTLTVTGVNIPAASMATGTQWRAEDPGVVSVAASGSQATVTAVQTGKTKVIVSNPESSNTLALDVKVGALYEWDDTAVVYIAAEADVVTMIKGERKTIGARLVNSTLQTGFTFSVSGSPIIDVSGSLSGFCLIEARETGVSEITVRNSYAVTEKEILVVVANTAEELRGFPYLTTKQNVVTVGESFNTSVFVSLVNVDGPVVSGYRWSSSDPSIVKVVDSGQAAVFYGEKAGTAKITVAHDRCSWPLEIIVNCVNPVLAANNPYIMSPNIITLTVGDAATTITADLVGGKPSDNTAFSWRVADGTIASCYAANETAQVKALKEGVTQLIISHPKANGVDRAVLLICEPRTTADCYITTTESIIRMSPSDSAKTITASLMNGKANDAYQFKWWADSYDIIEMNYSAESAVVKPLASGTVTIHISHPKANFQKDVVIYISQYTEFAFEKKSLSVTAGTQAFVNMQVPVSGVATKVSYASRTAQGGSASAIVSAGGTNSVCILDPHTEGSAVITASLVAVNSGAVLATCELLVSVAASGLEQTYINYSGDTIITIEKGVTKTLKATLAGMNAAAADSKSLQWKSSDPAVVKVAPASASGAAVNDEVQITALQAGRECTVTLSHEKAKSQVILYCIVPGENSASVALDRSLVYLIEGDNPYSLGASITNAAENDYTNLQWSVAQQQAETAALISGSGKKISIIPKKAGSAVITAKVPSSGKTASCTVTVEPPKTIILSKTSISTYPGEAATVAYTVSPPSETGTVTWTVSDSAYAQVSDDRQGTLTIYGKYKEGAAIVTGTTASKAVGQITVKNGWGNTFTLEKSLIKSVPVNKDDGAFDVKYEVKPACAELRIWGLSNMTLLAGTYDRCENGVYTMLPGRHASVDSESGIASGVIRFNPTGESKAAVIVQAWNPVATSTVNGTITPAEVASKQIQMNVYYNAYTFIPRGLSTNGKYSRFDEAAGGFIIGDGERMSFSLASLETNGTPQIEEVKFEPQSGEPAGSDGVRQQTLIAAPSVTGNGGFIIEHTRDYGEASSAYYGLVNAGDALVEKNNTTVRAVPLAGMIVIRYRLFGAAGIQEYRFPLYVEVRNCRKNY
ncbi:MAG: hypothetical protein LBQ14_01730 [Treponema sp.]|jgi:hypothetical protein|nr:hypothetical protein [Treponema sp.]